MPKTPIISTVFEGLGAVGQFAMNMTSLLAITAMVWMAWLFARRGQRALPIALVALLVFNLAGLVFAPSAAVTLTYHLIAIASLFMILHAVSHSSTGAARTVAVLLAASALCASELHQAMGALSVVLGAERPIGLGMAAFVVGEALVVASGLAFGWWMRPYREERWIWVAAVVPTVAFISMYLVAPSISGVLAIWSIGLTLFLPWPLYAVSLWAMTAAMLTGLKRGHPAGLAIALLVAGGYASQLSTQLFLSLTALYLLVGVNAQIDVRPSNPVDMKSAPRIGLRSGWKVEPQ
jgi:uncharacterized membrane protein YuzA (DUF378 family)